MKHSDFYIGLEFFGSAGFVWRCTDVGSRTITAIQLEDGRDASWYNGPPYAVAEVVFDEYDFASCSRSFEEGIEHAIYESDHSGHPGFPHEVVKKMLDEGFPNDATERYPNKPLLRLDRLRQDGELLHPYAARKSNGGWLVRLYMPFTEEFAEMPEIDFLQLDIAKDDDVKSRSLKGKK